jgi:hypothetical protein
MKRNFLPDELAERVKDFLEDKDEWSAMVNDVRENVYRQNYSETGEKLKEIERI